MYLLRKLARNATALIVLLATSLPALAGMVYFDNSATQWGQVYLYCWDSNKNPEAAWPGTLMTRVDGSDFWYYNVPEGYSNIIFAEKNGGAQSSDLTYTLDHFYTNDGDTEKTWEEYTDLPKPETVNPEPDPTPDPTPDPDPTGDVYVYFNGNWSNVHAYIYNESVSPKIENASWPGVAMLPDGPNGYWYYKVPANLKYNSRVIINTDGGPNRYPADQDPGMALNGKSMVFTVTGNQWSEYNGEEPVGFGPLGAFVEATDDGTSVTIKAEKGTLVVTPYSEEVVKIFTLPSSRSGAQERRSISVAAEPNATYTTDQDDDYYYISVTDGVSLKIQKASCLVRFCNADGSDALIESTGLINNDRNCSVNFESMGDKGFYGGGYNGKWMNVGGHSLRMNNTQTGGWPENDGRDYHNICIPFYVSTNGYGVYFDDHYIDASVMPSASGSSYYSGSEDPIAYYFIGGGNMERVLENYTLLTGRQELPPYWALGYITSKFSFASRRKAEEAIDKTLALNIPLDGIVFDIHWQGAKDENDEQVATQGFFMGNLDWNKNMYPNPEEMLANFKAKNVHSIAITEPYFAGSISNYQTLKNNGWLADEDVNGMSWVYSPSGLIDASNPDAMEWMNGFYKARTEEGLDGWWLDLGEPERHDGDSHHMGGNFNQIHNEFGNLWIESTYNGLKKNFPNMRHFLMPRAGTAGMQRFSTFPWTGDIKRSWNGLAAQIPALVNGSMSGMGYLGSDIGGFISEGTNPNLYLRWVQLGVFYPMMRTHSADQPEPYNSCYSSVVDKVRDFICLRYSYLPYTYTLSYRNTRFGSPIARPISFMDPDNASIADCMDEYLWGPDILVAPVVSENASSRNIIFPKGAWADLNDGKIYEGTANYAAPLERLPHFLREGAMVPRYMDTGFTSTADLNPDNVEVEFFPYRNNTGLMTAEMYEDDHVTPDPISTGDYHLTKFSALSNEYGVAVMIDHEGTRHFKPESMTSNQADVRRYVFHIYGHEASQEVSVIRYPAANTMARASEQSTPLSNHGSKDAFDNSDEDGYYVADNTTHVRISASPLETLLLSSGDAALVTGVTGTESINYLWLAYADGTINYSAPETADSLTLNIYGLDGTTVGEYTGLNATGVVNSVNVDLPAGVYIARLTARTSGSAWKSETLKIVVR